MAKYLEIVIFECPCLLSFECGMLALDAGYHVLCFFAALAFGLERTLICLKRRGPIRVTKCTNEFSFFWYLTVNNILSFIIVVYRKTVR